MGLSLLLRIVIAHLLADFFLQPYEWVNGKRQYSVKSKHLYYHVVTVGVLTYILMLDWSAWELPLFIAVTHFFIDWWKSNQEDTIAIFLADQTAHLLMIIAGWVVFTGVPAGSLNFIYELLYQPGLWIMIVSYAVVLRPIGFLIERATRRWRSELTGGEDEVAGLTDAGTWIGYIERVIILTFILLNEYSAIGFLIAAKSVFRFSGGVKDNKERKHAEYILIGTLISFSLAILVGIGALALIRG